MKDLRPSQETWANIVDAVGDVYLAAFVKGLARGSRVFAAEVATAAGLELEAMLRGRRTPRRAA